MVLSLRQKSEDLASQIESLTLKAQTIANHVLHGAHPRRKSGSGETFWQFREYTQDDDTRHIDWRQSAKTDRIYIKQKEEDRAQKALFWCNTSPSMRYSSDKNIMEKREAAQILSLALGLLIARGGDPVGSMVDKHTGHSEKSLTRLAHTLLGNNDAALPPTSSPIPAHAHLFLCGDFLNPIEDIAAILETLAEKTRNGCIIQILDPAELSFPFTGRIQFNAPSEHDPLTIDHTASIREDYIARITRHNEALKTLCNRLGWDYHLHRTDQPLEDILRRLV